MKNRVIYYSDEINEEFSGINRKTITVDENFEYIKKSCLWNTLSFIAYRLIMTPVAFLHTKLKFHHKIVNKQCLKKYKNTGYFVYGNHTLMGGDAYIPNLVNFPKKTYVIVNADNISQFGLKNFTLMNGAIPIPTNIRGMKNFMEAIEKRSVEGNAIQIYPEAHIWPYYTKIRPFKSISFKYPIKLDEPVFCFTNTFHKKKFGKTPKIITYVDGPFFPNKELSLKEQEIDLRNQVYNAMCERAKLSTYEYIQYIKKENTND